MLAAAALLAQAPPGETFENLSARARQAYEADRAEEAAGLLRRALKLKPDWAEGWWGLGSLQYQQGRFPECRDALAELTRVDPGAAAGWTVRGLCEFRLKQYDAALEHLKRGHGLAKGGGELRKTADFHLAMLLTRDGAFELAQEVYMTAARMARSDAAMLFACGVAVLRMPVLPEQVREADREVVQMAGQTFWDLATRPPEEAKADFEALVAKYPKFPNVHYFYGAYLLVHRPDDAVGEFMKELTVSPGHVPARVQIALQKLLQGQADEALRWAKEAVKLSPDSLATRLTLGRALMDSGREKEALGEFLTARRLNPESAEVRMYLATAYRALGQTAEAAREQQEFQRLKARTSAP